MTDLQTGLLIVGAVAVVAVLAYNRVLERRERRRLEEGFDRLTPDVLLDAPGSRDAAPAPQRAVRTEPVESAPLREPEPAARDGEALPDERIDFVVELVCREPAPAASVLAQWEPIAKRFTRRALLAGAGPDREWHGLSLQDSRPSAHLRLGLQLASRQGAAPETELIEFRAMCDAVAAHLGAGIAAPEVRKAGEESRALDALCAEADIQLVLHLDLSRRPGGGIEARDAAVGAAAAAAGLVAAPGGPWTKAADGGGTLFQAGLANDRFSLVLDVPRCPDLRNAFGSMLAAAREMSTRLGAGIVDDNGRPLGDAALQGIGVEVERVRVALEQRGVPAGSALARRLFS